MHARQNRTGAVAGSAEAGLAARVEMLFRRFPVLCGFSVQPGRSLSRERAAGRLEADLFLADVECAPGLSAEHHAALCEEISRVLLDVVDEEPGTLDLLPGRTFARTVH